MKKHDSKQVRDAVGALDFDGVAVSEIHRRLQADEAGIGFKVDISQRQVYNYRLDYRAEHGLPQQETSPNARTESIESLKERLIALVSRELSVLEKRRPGSQSKDTLSMAKSFRSLLHDWERKEASAIGRLPQSQITKSARNKAEIPSEESILDKLAREDREARTNEVVSGNPEAVAA